MAWIVESVETCTGCGEVSLHRRRRVALARVVACSLLALALLPCALRWIETRALAESALLFVFALLVARGLWTWDQELRWDLACSHCREHALAQCRRLKRAPRTIDFF